MTSQQYRSAHDLISTHFREELFSGEDLATVLINDQVAANQYEIDQIGTLLLHSAQITVDDPKLTRFERSNKKQYRFCSSSSNAADVGGHDGSHVYDLVIIGGGYGGIAAGYQAQYLGLNSALIHEPHSKYHLIMQRLHQQHADHCLRPADILDNNLTLIDQTSQIHHDLNLDRLQQIGCTLYSGSGRFTSINTVQVGETEIRFRKAVIATGSIRTASLMSQLDQCLGHCIKSDRVVVIGSSRFPRSLEICSLLARLSNQVILLCRERDLITGLHSDHIDHVKSILKKSGIHLIFISKFVRVSDSKLHPELIQFLVLYVNEDDQPRSIQAQYVIDFSENRAHVMDLDLELAGVKYSETGGIQVDDFYVTSNRNICAVGDCITSRFYRSWQLAQFQGQDAVTNAFIRIRRFSDVTIPVIIESSPKIAQVVFVINSPSSSEIEKFREPIEDGFLDIFVDSGSGRVLSAFAIGSHADLIITSLTYCLSKDTDMRRLSLISPTDLTRSICNIARRIQRSRYSPFRFILRLLYRKMIRIIY